MRQQKEKKSNKISGRHDRYHKRPHGCVAGQHTYGDQNRIRITKIHESKIHSTGHGKIHSGGKGHGHPKISISPIYDIIPSIQPNHL